MGRKPEAVTPEQTKLDPKRTFGVELELTAERNMWEVEEALTEAGILTYVESYNHDTRDYWKIVEDCSVYAEWGMNPMELVSPPLRGSEGLRELARVCEVLADIGCDVNPSCGLHVHHDARDFDIDAWRWLVKCALKYEDAIDALMDVERRGDNNSYCHAMRRHGYSVEEMFSRVDEAWDVDDLSCIWYSRFMKLNLDSYRTHGTVEFRQHGGTLDFAEIAAWVSLTQGLVTRAIAGKAIRLRELNRPLESLLWTAEACAGVRRHYQRKYKPSF